MYANAKELCKQRTVLIRDVAVISKMPPTTELNLYLSYLGNQQSCYKKTVVGRMLYETHAHIYNKRMLVKQDFVTFRMHIA